MREFRDGYMGHDWLAMGHMDQASAELLQIFPQRADDIRKYRKKYEEDRNFEIPILDIINMITDEFEALPDEEQEVATHDSRKKSGKKK